MKEAQSSTLVQGVITSEFVFCWCQIQNELCTDGTPTTSWKYGTN